MLPCDFLVNGLILGDPLLGIRRQLWMLNTDVAFVFIWGFVFVIDTQNWGVWCYRGGFSNFVIHIINRSSRCA